MQFPSFYAVKRNTIFRADFLNDTLALYNFLFMLKMKIVMNEWIFLFQFFCSQTVASIERAQKDPYKTINSFELFGSNFNLQMLIDISKSDRANLHFRYKIPAASEKKPWARSTHQTEANNNISFTIIIKYSFNFNFSFWKCFSVMKKIKWY